MKTFAYAAAFVLAALTPVAAAAPSDEAIVKYVPANTSPPVPAGLKVTCFKNPNKLDSSSVCPVVVYHGITTWAYSYIDNRVSFALVSYDANNKIVANVEKPGARYVWNVTSSIPDKEVIFFGQSNQRVDVPWATLGGGK
jgi:hypothetical protein